uniref:Uncharacterized protein n=1 Tax=Alexandrium andersonii TaxID=327968 RepID=A0A7S2MD97_9DINO
MGASVGLCGGCCLGCGLGYAGRRLRPKLNQKMLVCEVFLGTPWTVRSATRVQPEVHFQRGWLMKALGAEDYNSVYVPGGLFSTVNVPEYVVYEPCQAVPKYVIEFTCEGSDEEF